jgi:cytochrome c-type biogenesis protein CcmE
VSDTTVYTLYPEVGTDTRGRYFDGQFLTAQDFVDEQRYHVDRLRRTLDLLTTPGVARGLELTPAGPWLLRLAPGTAIDDRGRLLVVTALRDNIPVPRDLPGGAADVSLFYAEVEARVQGGTAEEQGTRGATRLRELPALEFHALDVAPKNAGAVRIGRIRVDNVGTIVLDPPAVVRATVGLRLPAEPDGGPVLRSGGGARPNLLQATGDVAVSGKLAVGTPDPEAALDIRGLARVDDLSVREHTFRVDGDEATFYPIVFRDNDWTAGAALLELTRANAQADAANAGALIARLLWHASDGNSTDLFACDIVQSRRFVANARTLAKDKLLCVWLRGNRTYAWRGSQRTELLDGRAVASKSLGNETLSSRADIDPAFDRDRVSLGVTYDQIALRGSTSVTGDLAYTGKQSRLDAAEQPSATIRATDLNFGHSTRRGAPGRALVDLLPANATKTLSVNYAGDWPALSLGGAATTVEGTLSVVGDATAQKALGVGTTLNVGGDATLQKKLTVTGLVTASAGLTVTGDVTYSGKQSRLDTSEQAAATVRASDFYLGHSTRRGTPGRALVDETTTLTVNYNNDWATLGLNGTTIVSQGNFRAAKDAKVDGNTTLSGKLDVGGDTTVAKLSIAGDTVVTANEPYLRLHRVKGQATGGAKVFLELRQDDAAPATVPEVGVSLLFHHGNRFWHRIEGRGDGLHIRHGDLTTDDYKQLFAANIYANGKHVTTGAAERLRIVRGTVNGSGGIETGSGFSISKSGVLWKITFDTAFAAAPTLVVTQQFPDNNSATGDGNTRDNAVVVAVKSGEAYIKTGNGDGDQSWRRFHFIAIGTF